MPRVPPSATRDTVLDATLALLREIGIRRTTIEQVSQRSGLSRSTIHRYWHTKDALITATFQRSVGRFIADQVAAVQQEPTFADRVVRAAVFLRERLANWDLLAIRTDEPQGLAVLIIRELPREFPGWIDHWARWVTEAQAVGEVRADVDPHRVGEWILRMMVSFVTMPGTAVDLDDPDDLAAFVTESIVDRVR